MNPKFGIRPLLWTIIALLFCKVSYLFFFLVSVFVGGAKILLACDGLFLCPAFLEPRRIFEKQQSFRCSSKVTTTKEN